MISQAKVAALDGTPLIEHFVAVVVVVVAFEVVVLTLGVVDGAAGVVLMALVVDGAAGVVLMALVVEGAAGVVLMALVVDGAAGVVDSCLFFCAFVQGAVTVTVVTAAVPVCVAVVVTSVMGTKEEQKAEAFIATRMASQAATSLRSCRSARARWRAEARGANIVVATTKPEKKRMAVE